MDVLSHIGRKHLLFDSDIQRFESEISDVVSQSKFLVLGGAGSIGQAVVKEIFKRNPELLHVVDLSENNLVELVRDIRSSFGYIKGEFKTFALDIGSPIFQQFFQKSTGYDYVLNLSALKHVRSEKDPFTLMRLIQTNIFHTTETIRLSAAKGAKKYFCVSTDKAANPVNMMGASKRIMEMFAARESAHIPVSMARFANVAFSDGSLLHGFKQRIAKGQPLVGPSDILRYFITPQEAGELCLMSCLFGGNQEVFFPKPGQGLDLIGFQKIAESFLQSHGYTPDYCQSEGEARDKAANAEQTGKWPCLFQPSTTTGEKPEEEFFTDRESLDLERFASIGVIVDGIQFSSDTLAAFEQRVDELFQNNVWSKTQLISIFQDILPSFNHIEKGLSLDSKM